MGGPSYQTPYPVKQPSGKTIIWNWGTKTWDPYDPAKAKADAARQAGSAGSGDREASGPSGEAPDRSAAVGEFDPGTGPDAGRAGSRDGGAPDQGPSFPQRRRAGRVAPRPHRGYGTPGESLLERRVGEGF